MRTSVVLALLWPLSALAQTPPAPPPGSATTNPFATGAPHMCEPRKWYPRSAVAHDEQGITGMAFRIDIDGATKGFSVTTSSGFADLDQAAIACASEWKYKPAIENGHPVEVPWSAKVTWKTSGIPPRPIGPAPCKDELRQMTGSKPSGIHFVVGVDGTLKDIELVGSTGDSKLDQNLISCVSKWKFLPGAKGGQPVEFKDGMPLNFLEMKSQ